MLVDVDEQGAIDNKDVEQALKRITLKTNLQDLATSADSAGIVIEAVTESELLKAKIFKQLDVDLPPDVILASNTSSISITRLGAATSRPAKVIGMHFMVLYKCPPQNTYMYFQITFIVLQSHQIYISEHG